MTAKASEGAVRAARAWKDWPMPKETAKATLKLSLQECKLIDEEIVNFALAERDRALEKALKNIDQITGPTGGWLDSPAYLKELMIRSLKGGN